MHCAVPFFCARSGTEGEAGRRCGEWVVRAERNASRSLRACVGAAWACIVAGRGSGSARGGRVLCGGEGRSSAGNGLCGRRACIAQPAGVSRGCVEERKCSGRACRCAWASGGLRRGMCYEVGEECIAQPAGVRRGGEGVRKCSGRACRCAGVSEGLRWGMGGEVGGHASVLRGGAKVLGKGASLCGGERRSSAGNGW